MLLRDNALRQGLDPTAFDFLPVTYALPAELPALLRAQAQNPERTWILKPAGGSGGREIAITSSAKEMKAYSAERGTGTADTLPETSIASHYIDAPLLVDERKTDLRVYVLVTSFQPLRAYIYRCVRLSVASSGCGMQSLLFMPGCNTGKVCADSLCARTPTILRYSTISRFISQTIPLTQTCGSLNHLGSGQRS